MDCNFAGDGDGDTEDSEDSEDADNGIRWTTDQMIGSLHEIFVVWAIWRSACFQFFVAFDWTVAVDAR